MRTNVRQRGVSLVELMVAITIGLMILLAVSVVFINSNRTYRTTDSTARLQENARIALAFIGRDIRQAGYLGCLNDFDNLNSTLNGGLQLNGIAINPLSGTETCPATGSCTTSDTLTLQFLDQSTAVNVTQAMPNEAAAMFVTAPNNINDNDIIVLSDCDGADVMQVTNANRASGGTPLVHNAGAGSPGNSTQKLSKSYSTDAQIMRFSQIQYRIDNNPRNIPALFRGAEELVEGVENMQVLYGVHNAGTNRIPNKYVTFPNVPDWRRVVSIRVGLLLTSLTDTATGEYGQDVDTQTYTVNDTVIDPPDARRIRKVFTATYQLRNVR